MDQTLASPAVENYLKAIYLLEAKTGKPVPTSKLAERLAVAPASVTEMVQRLARDGLVKHVRYRGVRLTARVGVRALARGAPSSPPGDVPGRRARHGLGARCTTRPRRSSTRSQTGSWRPSPPSSAILPATRTAIRSPRRSSRSTRARRSLSIVCRSAQGGASCASSTPMPDLLGYLDGLGIALGDELEVLDLEPFGGPFTVSLARAQAQPRPACRGGPQCGVAASDAAGRARLVCR